MSSSSSIRRPQPGDRIRKVADTQATIMAWFTVSRVAFKPEGDYRHVLALESAHDVDGNLCFHLATAAPNDQHGDAHALAVEYDKAARPTCDQTPH